MYRRFAGVACAGLWLSLAIAAPVAAQQKPADTTQSAPDNTKVNKGDQLNAGSQKNGKQDVAITRDIRRAIVADKNLSTYAHNVKVITQHGEVTLKGPVAAKRSARPSKRKPSRSRGRDASRTN